MYILLNILSKITQYYRISPKFEFQFDPGQTDKNIFLRERVDLSVFSTDEWNLVILIYIRGIRQSRK